MKHLITLKAAVDSLKLYRNHKETVLSKSFGKKDILPICETFDRAAIDALLKVKDCKAVRIYYGMKEDHKIHAILVGVNSKNEDIIPSETNSGRSAKDAAPPILEEATRCPDDCPPKSPLNHG